MLSPSRRVHRILANLKTTYILSRYREVAYICENEALIMLFHFSSVFVPYCEVL